MAAATIDRTRLPAASDIRFKELKAWEPYRRYAFGALSVLALQTLLIAGLFAQRAKRRRAEEAIRTQDAARRTSYERIRQLAGRLIGAQDAAQARIARDLHDDVSQQLSLVSMAVSALRRQRGDMQEPRAQSELAALQDRAFALIECVRRLSDELHPTTLRHVGLRAALEAHCAEVERQHDTQVSFAAVGDFTGVPTDTAVCLYRISQEALRNAAVHADARRVSITVSRSDACVELTIADDGRGFDVDGARRSDEGLGLVSMEERARLVGGQFTIVTHPGQGTTIRVRVPAAATVMATI